MRKTIFILSSNFDQSTSDVMDWLLKAKANVVRFDYSNEITVQSTSISEKGISICFKYKNENYSTSDIKTFWYRKGVLKPEKIESDKNAHPGVTWYLIEEQKAIINYLEIELDKYAPINHIQKSDINKLLQLSTALQCGLKIPETLLTTSASEADRFIDNHQDVITKSIQVPFMLIDEKINYSLFTSVFDKKDVQNVPTEFFMTKFQKQILKQYELRIFFIRNTFYSMAIFSQNNDQTKIDFRNYDYQVPNRKVPYELPENIKLKLTELMTKLGLLSGSIDMLVDSANEYYFLEVNPVGQFGMVSKPCNYNIEKDIANFLSQ
jgi:ATP-GRASP peptide maturase of grasp-with-spasm system